MAAVGDLDAEPVRIGRRRTLRRGREVLPEAFGGRDRGHRDRVLAGIAGAAIDLFGAPGGGLCRPWGVSPRSLFGAAERRLVRFGREARSAPRRRSASGTGGARPS